MKVLIVLGLVAVASSMAADDFYSGKYDNFNVEELVSSDRLLRAYTDCFLGVGKCTPEGKATKEHLGDAVSTGCSMCSPKQKVIARTAINAIKNKLPKDFVKLKDMYSPGGKYEAKINEFLAETS